MLACSFKSCKEAYSLPHVIRTSRRNWEVSCCLPPLYWDNFFQKKLFIGGRHFWKNLCKAKLFTGVSMETWGGCLGRLGVGGNYLWCLVIVVTFMEHGGAKRLGGWGGFKVIIWGGQAITERTNFYGGIYKYILLHSFYTLSICIVWRASHDYLWTFLLSKNCAILV